MQKLSSFLCIFLIVCLAEFLALGRCSKYFFSIRLNEILIKSTPIFILNDGSFNRLSNISKYMLLTIKDSIVWLLGAQALESGKIE